MENKAIKVLISVVLILVAVLSFTFGGDKFSNPETYTRTIGSLDANSDTVLELVAASTLVSAAVSAIPDDTATPIAEKIADFTEYFLLVLCVLFTEKYLLTIVGAAAFRIMIPLACALGIFSLFSQNGRLKHIASRIALISLTLFLITPISVRVSDTIYATYRSSIDDIIGSAEELANETTDLENISDNDGLFDTLVNDGFSEFFVRLRDKASRLLNNFVEALAVIIVASCIIPLLSMIFLLWLIKTLTGIEVNAVIPRLGRRKKLPLPHIPEGASFDDSDDAPHEPMQ